MLKLFQEFVLVLLFETVAAKGLLYHCSRLQCLQLMAVLSGGVSSLVLGVSGFFWCVFFFLVIFRLFLLFCSGFFIKSCLCV